MNRGCVAACVVLISLGALGFWYLKRPPLVVRELPASATEVHWEKRNMFPDWSFSMAAALSEEECRAHVARVFSDLDPLEPAAVRAALGEEAEVGLSWARTYPDPDRPWWHPQPVSQTATWYGNNGGAWELIQCTGEHVFYEDFSR
ncbi:MAG: hypothetical protein AAF938_08195 [Myxococcota bacterium]